VKGGAEIAVISRGIPFSSARVFPESLSGEGGKIIPSSISDERSGFADPPRGVLVDSLLRSLFGEDPFRAFSAFI